MDIRFDGKVALITGSGTGIGRATAIEFARNGAAVVVNYNASVQAASEVINLIKSEGGKAIAVKADVTKKSDVDFLIQTAVDTFHGLDILVNNAGTLVERKTIENTSEELWDKIMDVNLKSVYLCTQAVIPIMKKKGSGRIINVTSVAARNGGGLGAGHYSAAKAGVLTLTKNLAKELAPTGILVNGISPGVIATRYHDIFTSPENRANAIKSIPLGREGKPQEVAYAILFLASEFATYFLGETLEINGGIWMD
ncbi:3-oxoacyl-ACP reductase FabG [candidate division KSB1 bacterium]|nr:3-oxoacyl-ACP reductase FabG [candidate division KSB1 bacterium]